LTILGDAAWRWFAIESELPRSPQVLQKKGDKSAEEYDKHQEELEGARGQLGELEQQIKSTKGPKKQRPIKEKIRAKKEDIKGLIKEIGQKWPAGRPAE